MPNWTYSDWITLSTAAARVARLRSHIAEVAERIAESMSSAGRSVNTADLRQYRAELMANLKEEEAKVSGAGSNGGFVRGRIVDLQ